MACMSATKFKCCFREAYGMTAFEYVRDVRVAEAIKLLEVKELPVAAIAKTVGYHKPRAFTKVFKDHTALLPKQYRNFLEGGAR
jgi:transcriptional regulator GlxA family with amidase domain